MERWGETLLGAAVALVAIGFFAFAAAAGGGQGAGAGKSYELFAQFQRIDGINVGSDVRVSGVKVGVVRDVRLNPETYLARVTLAIQPGVLVLNDSMAKVQSDGLLGGAHVAIEPSGFEPLEPGGEILNTQGSVDLLTLMASMMRGSSQTTEQPAESPSTEPSE
jgi:phospholipid/cholesterol/gamma-HCH transport system substrate-binding protein